MSNRKDEKVIRIALRTSDVDKVKIDFHGGIFTPEEFTSLFMGVLETYTVGLMKTNSKEAVFNHWNNVFGIFLNKIVPEHCTDIRHSAHLQPSNQHLHCG